MKKLIEAFYSKVYGDEPAVDPNDKKEEVPFRNKANVFYISLVITLVIIFFIVKDIVKNLQSI